MSFYRRGWFVLPLVILGAALAGGIFGPRLTAQTKESQEKVQDSLRRITEVLEALEQNYATEVDPERAIYNGAIPGMLVNLDPHSNFFDPKAFAQLREDQRGRYFGVGMQVAPRNGQTIVMVPFPGSPAYKAGLRPGDIIHNVDGTPTEGLSTAEVASLLKGPRGTSVQVQVLREGVPEPLEFAIVRDEIPRLSIEHAFEIEPGIGYVRIASFNENTSDELRQRLRELDVANLGGMVLDLRDNPGGLLSEGVAVSEMFLQRGQLIVSHRGRASREKQYTVVRGSRGDSFPLVILINKMTASAAEIVSGAVQDHDRGLIVGEQSFGKGLVQTVYPLNESTGLALTTAKYYTPSGRLIQRDYSNVSYYNYLNSRNESGVPDTTDVRKTDTGRTVYGGGGITPDVEIAPPDLNEFETLLLRRDVFFNFAGRYLAGHDQTVSRDFVADEAVLEQFRAFLAEKEIEYEEADLMANLDFVTQRIELQLALSVFGMNEAYRLEAAHDPHIQRAIELLPQAALMLETTRRAQLQQENQQDTQ